MFVSNINCTIVLSIQTNKIKKMETLKLQIAEAWRTNQILLWNKLRTELELLMLNK